MPMADNAGTAMMATSIPIRHSRCWLATLEPTTRVPPYSNASIKNAQEFGSEAVTPEMRRKLGGGPQGFGT